MVHFIFKMIQKLILYPFLRETSNYLDVESGEVTVYMTQLFFMDQGIHLVWKSASDFDLRHNTYSSLFSLENIMHMFRPQTLQIVNNMSWDLVVKCT